MGYIKVAKMMILWFPRRSPSKQSQAIKWTGNNFAFLQSNSIYVILKYCQMLKLYTHFSKYYENTNLIDLLKYYEMAIPQWINE